MKIVDFSLFAPFRDNIEISFLFSPIQFMFGWI
jgi:hypothetical protein